jgi:predicted AAA+ superfamily ATPase
MELIQRKLTTEINESLRHFPVVAITGPRQCGKSTLVRYLLENDKELLYLGKNFL